MNEFWEEDEHRLSRNFLTVMASLLNYWPFHSFQQVAFQLIKGNLGNNKM